MPKVVLIEDDVTMVSLLKTLLEIEGFSVFAPPHAGSEDIVPMLIKERPDITLIDIHLKRKSGLDILRCLRQDPAMRSAKVLMTSGSDLSEKCIAEGADAFLLKPYMPDDLVHLIRAVLAK